MSRFPSATGSFGFKPLADKIHALGLHFGIHIMRGVPCKSVSANTPIGLGDRLRHGRRHTEQPADDQPARYHQAEVDAIRSAIDKASRTIVLSLSPGPMRTADAGI